VTSSTTPRPAMNPIESRAAFSLAGIFSLRMLGLFLILPVFALYAEHLEGVTPVLVGVAIGAYGLTQALLQIPFGMLSDRIGRKPVIVTGLLIFAAGSVVAALSTSISGVILGRALQGAGAIAAVVMALAADLTREEVRTRIMAIIGVSIGVAFTVSMILGPLLDHWIGVPGIFWLTALLALIGVVIVILVVPTPERSHFHHDAEPVRAQFAQVLGNRQLRRLDVGILTLHMVLTATFLAVPLALRHLGLATSSHTWFYLPVMVLAMGLMVPFIVIAERRRRMRSVFLGAVLLLGLAQLLLYAFHQSLIAVGLILLLFFTAFNVLEASLPSLVSKIAPAQNKGTAMGVYSSSQFIGAFLGGLIGGWVHHEFGLPAVFLFGGGAVLLWWLYALGMEEPPYLASHLIRVGSLDQAEAWELERELRGIPGVGDAAVVVEEGVAYLKIDHRAIDMATLEKYAVDA